MRKTVVMLVLSPIVLAGCGPKVIKTKTAVYQLFEKDFQGFALPEIDEIKEGAGRGTFRYTEFDQVWDSAIIVLMQQGVVLKASKEAGIIVGMGEWPLGILVERSDPVNVHIRLITNLYKRLDDPKKTAFDFQPDNLAKIHRSFYDKLATQVYAGQKWKYLSAGAGE